MAFTIPPSLALALAVPVLLLGEFVLRRMPVLARINLPVPVVGGLLVCLAVLAVNATGGLTLGWGKSDWPWWNWLAGTSFTAAPARDDVHRPFLVAFFTCVGLTVSGGLLRRGGLPLVLFWGLASLLAVAQNFLGWGLASAQGQNPLLGLVGGSVSMTGGHGTALGNAEAITQAGLPGAGPLGAAAATFGLVAGALLGGPLAGWLIARHRLATPGAHPAAAAGAQTPPPDTGEDDTFLATCAGLWRAGAAALGALALVMLLVKVGSVAGEAVKVASGWSFPAYLGAMVLAIVVRNAAELLRLPFFSDALLTRLTNFFLGLFLALVMAQLNLAELAAGGQFGPLLVILVVQVTVAALFVAFITFPLMGRDYEAATMAAGHLGFGLGATPTAVANMGAVASHHGPAPKAFLIVTTCGAFLIDLPNAAAITWFLNLLGAR